MLEKLNIRCYLNQVKKKFYCMNGVRVLTVIVSAQRTAHEDLVQRSFLSDVSLSKH